MAVIVIYRTKYVDCSQSSIFSYFYSIVERADRIARELVSAQKEELTGWGGGWGLRKIKGHWTSLKKSEFPVSPETENSHW